MAERPDWMPEWATDDDLDGVELLASVGMLHAEAAGIRKVRSRYPGDEYERPPLRIGYVCDPGDGWVWTVSAMYMASGKQGRWHTSRGDNLGLALRSARRVQLVHREATQ